LEFVMNKIMKIDKDAQIYRNGIEKQLKEKQNELENIIEDMLISFQEESKNIKNDICSEKIIEAEHKVGIIKKEKEEELSNINRKYQINKLDIVEIVFNRIVKSV